MKKVKVKVLQDSFVDIFISHSSLDSSLAKVFIELLKLSLNISSSRIRCTSIHGNKLGGGIVSADQLRREIKAAKIFIALITPGSVKSTYVVCEIGARWGYKQRIIPLICSRRGAKLLKAPLNEFHAINCCTREEVFQLVNQLASEFGITAEYPYVYSDKVNELVALAKKG